MTTERPILFSAPMIRALLAGTKTQTRRVVKDTGLYAIDAAIHGPETAARELLALASRCPYGQPGNKLWVRETFAKIDGQTQPWIETDYRATYTHGDRLGDSIGLKKRWTPAIHMPRAASRITLEVAEVRVERLQAISEADARAEGVDLQPRLAGYSKDAGCGWAPQDPVEAYCNLWDQINGAGAWGANPWVWAVSFRVVKP